MHEFNNLILLLIVIGMRLAKPSASHDFFFLHTEQSAHPHRRSLPGSRSKDDKTRSRAFCAQTQTSTERRALMTHHTLLSANIEPGERSFYKK
jgi:hypothetical protein